MIITIIQVVAVAQLQYPSKDYRSKGSRFESGSIIVDFFFTMSFNSYKNSMSIFLSASQARH